MNATTIIGFTAHAEVLCVPDAERIFEFKADDDTVRYDGEGNEVRPIFASDEIADNEACAVCGEPISD